MFNNDVYKQIYKLVKSYDEIVIARHVGPDPDAVASSIALRDSIRLTFPEKKVYTVGAGVNKFRFLGFPDRLDYNSITNALLIVLDVPNYKRVDGIEGLSYKDIVKIDHHPKEDIIGTVDFTSSNYSSTAEMVAELIFNSKFKMNKSIAEKLFMGIVSDSERFLFNNTTANTFRIALKLIESYNLNFVSLYQPLYEKSINECKFEAHLIDNLTITENKLGYEIIDNKDIQEYGVDSSTPSVLINNLNNIKELLVWVFVTFDERNQVYKVNIRSRGPIINVVANKYNGGGHDFASGARIYEKEKITDLFNDLDIACKEYLEANSNEENN